jgi:hypothetical protein
VKLRWLSWQISRVIMPTIKTGIMHNISSGNIEGPLSIKLLKNGNTTKWIKNTLLELAIIKTIHIDFFKSANLVFCFSSLFLGNFAY